MNFNLPFKPPFTSATYPDHAGYDVANTEPDHWRLLALVRSTTSIKLTASCSGILSTVPPWQLREQGPANLRAADGVMPGAVTLFLQPVSTDLHAVNMKLRANGLGDEILCFVYRNVDPNKLGPEVTAAINLYGNSLYWLFATNTEALEHFAEGEFAVHVNGGVLLGEAASPNPGPLVGAELEFGVLTSTGFVDPAAFFDVMMSPRTGDVTAFVTLFGSNWPVLGGTGTQVTIATAARPYPTAVLYEAKRRLTAAEWGAVGLLQEEQYWKRLLVSVGTSQSGSAFVFNTDDMFNPFQIAAVIEFFLAWPDPAIGGSPLITFPPLLQRKVDLTSGWHFVVIDPFDNPKLGMPLLPPPDYELKPYTFTGLCVEPNVPSSTSGSLKTLHPDLFRGVLFLLFAGEVKAYYRWSTYSAHRWEDPSQDNKTEVSSVKGNVGYNFNAWTSNSVANINYGFQIYKPDDADQRTDGRFYFQSPVPTADDPDGKTAVMVHIGFSADAINPTKNYNGSGGCIVSPSFPSLRRRVAELYQADPTALANLSPFVHSTHESCKEMYKTRKYKSDWDYAVTGHCWIVRPDEPTSR